MLFTRRSATIAVLVVLACTTSLLGGFSAGPRGAASAAGASSMSPPSAVSPRAVSPAAVKPPASHTGLGRPRVNAPIRPGSVFSYPNRGKKNQVAIRQRILNTIKSTWGGRRFRTGVRAPVERQIRHRHLDVRRLGDRAGALQGSSARRECPGARGQGPQQGTRAMEVAAQASFPNGSTARASGQRQPVELRPALPGFLPRLRWHGTLEVLPVLQRRLVPRAHDHGAELDEPDQDGLPGPVEPGVDHLAHLAFTARSTRSLPSRAATGRSPTPTAIRDGPVRASSSPAPAPPASLYDPVMRALGAVGARAPRPVGTGCTALGSGSSSTRSTTAAGSGSPSG